ncbi:hypothetical protein ACHAWC_006133 [Mediolabrus comicus]
MAAERRLVDTLIGGENHQITARGPGPASSSEEGHIHAVWREKVIKWYFAIVSALDRQHERDSASPFNRSAVHITAALLDSYIMSLPSERSRHYMHDRAAYQLLATACLLVGLRLTQHDQLGQSTVRSSEDNPTCQLKRAKTHRDHMDQASRQEEDDAASSPQSERPHVEFAIPTAATILQMSAASKSMTESKVLTMVREVTGSRAFPRSHVVTALDFIRALVSTNSIHDQHGNSNGITLSPEVAEQACRLVDKCLRDATLVECRPSIVGSAAITLALFRYHHGSDDIATLRHQVCSTIFGVDADPSLQVAVRNVEAKMLAAVQVPISRHARVNPIMHHVTAHLIPLEDE